MSELSRQELLDNIKVMQQAVNQIEMMAKLSKCLVEMSTYFELFSEVSLKSTLESLQQKIDRIDQANEKQFFKAANDI